MNSMRLPVVIADYGMGNLFSIQRVISYLGGIAEISRDPDTIASAERLILPGVGAFGDGMDELKTRGMIGPLKDFALSGRPLLGICLGMQLLMKESSEFGLHEGLGFIPGAVRKMSGSVIGEQNYKIPHVGWNRLYAPRPGCWKKTILGGIKEEAYAYFVHSYVVVPDSPDAILADTAYGNERFCSAIAFENLAGCQFHPEVSGEAGLSILRKFLAGS